MTASLEIVGVKDALRTLQRLDKSTRRQLTKDYREIVQPIINDARPLTPTKAPISGFDRSWTPKGSSESILPYTGNTSSRAPRKPSKRDMNFPGGRRQMVQWMKWSAGQRAFISGKMPKEFNGYIKNLTTFGVRWQGPAATLFDTSSKARTPQGSRMVAALSSRFGQPSRVMWRAYESAAGDVQDELQDLIKKIMREAERAIQTQKTRGF